jgi:hypothetical protein
MEKIIHSLIDNWTKGVDTYTHNGSTWLIFTDNKQWVIELTEQKTLWYNYNFFKQIFEFTSLDVVDNQHYITKWVEDNIINKVEHTSKSLPRKCSSVDDVIENGVKETLNFDEKHTLSYEQGVKKLVEDTIKNGVKETINHNCDSNDLMSEFVIKNGVSHTEIGWHQCNNIDDAIEKGVKETMFNQGHKRLTVKNIIENGVKEIYDYKGHRWDVKDVIQDGVRDISPMTQYTDWQVEEIIENGVKETDYKSLLKRGEIEDIIYSGVKHTQERTVTKEWIVEDTLQNGVKKTKCLDKSEITEKEINNTIQNGVKETNWFEGPMRSVVDNVIDDGINHTEIGWHQCNNVDDVIEKGIKETKGDASQNPMGKVTKVIKNGIKKSIAAGYEHPNSLVYVKWPDEIDEVLENGVKETNHVDVMKFFDNKMDDVIDNGVKEIHRYRFNREDEIDETIQNGVKETHSVSKNLFWQIGDTIQNGVKETNHIKNNVRETKQFEEHLSCTIDDVIENGVKETKVSDYFGDNAETFITDQYIIDRVIENGVKETKTPGNGDIMATAEWMKENNSTSYPKMIDDVIENGVKETIATGIMDTDSGRLYVKWDFEIDEVIETGVKQTKADASQNPMGKVTEILRDGKINGTFVGGKKQKEDIESVIGYGTKNPSV